MSNQGWIKIYREMLDNPIVTKDADHIAVWIYLLLNATHTEYSGLFKGKKIMLKPGQLITGNLSIASQLRITESKVRRCLNEFKSDGQIDRQTSNKNSLITILNWDLYQSSDGQNVNQVTDKWRTSDGQVTDKWRTSDDKQECKNKELKNEKNVKNKIIYGEYRNVKLTQEEYDRLANDFGVDVRNKAISFLDSYIEEKGYKSKSHNLAIRRWVIEAVNKADTSGKKMSYVEAVLNRNNICDEWLKGDS